MNNSLDRFLIAQEHSYDTALREIRSGRKRSHWMWYIFPQIAGLGMSYTAQLYAIKDIEEARQYIAHPRARRAPDRDIKCAPHPPTAPTQLPSWATRTISSSDRA